MGKTPVSYWVIEDEDDEKCPNVFHVGREPARIRLGDLQKLFPLPGQYHWRFKVEHQSLGYVWLDVTDAFATVPQFKGKITCKLSRLASAAGYAPAQPQQAPRQAPRAAAAAPEPEKKRKTSLERRRSLSSDDLIGMAMGSSDPPPGGNIFAAQPPQSSQPQPMGRAAASSIADLDFSMPAAPAQQQPTLLAPTPMGVAATMGGSDGVRRSLNGTPIGGKSANQTRTSPTRQKRATTMDPSTNLASQVNDFHL